MSRGGNALRPFDLCTDRNHDRREDRSLEQISWLAVLLWHVLDEQHERRDEQEQYLQLAQLREAVVACVEIKFLAARLRNRWIMASTPSTRRLLDGVWRCWFLTARRSQHGRVLVHPTHWLIYARTSALGTFRPAPSVAAQRVVLRAARSVGSGGTFSA